MDRYDRNLFGGNSNLPPGCRVSDIPGNRPEDGEWEIIEDGFWSNEKNCSKELWNKFDELKLGGDLIDVVTKAIEYGMELGRKEQVEIDEFNKSTDHMWKLEVRNPKLIKYFKEQRQESELLFIHLEEFMNQLNEVGSVALGDMERAQTLLNQIRGKNNARITPDNQTCNRCIQDSESNR